MSNHLSRCVPLLLSVAASTTPVLAADAADASTERGLDEVVVTAQRVEETLQKAAIAISVASAADLERVGVLDATTLNKAVPSLYVTNGGGANTAYFVRGVGNFTNNGYTNPAVAFNLDGVYLGRPSATLAAFLDLGRVEVLKGPQGTLYGRNSTGGAINVIPNQPVLGETTGTVTAGLGNFSAYDVSAVGNFAIGERSAIRLAGVVAKRDGFFDDGTGDQDEYALRAQYYFEPSESFSLRVSADYSSQGGTGSGTHIDGAFAFTPFSPTATVRNWTFRPAPAAVRADYAGLHTPQALQFIAANASAAPLFSRLEGYAYPFRDDTYWGINAELNWDLGWGSLVAIPAYRYSELDNQFNGPPFRAAINQDEAVQSSLEVRLSSQAGPVDWILGAYYFDESSEGVNSFNQFSTVTHNAFDFDTESAALFARASWSLTDAFRLVGGVRYTDESRTVAGAGSSTAGVCRGVSPAGPPNCSHVPNIPVGLTLQDSLSRLSPSLFPGRSPFAGGPITGAYPYGPLNFFAPTVPGPGALLVVTPAVFGSEGGDEEVTYRAALEYDLTPTNLLYASFETGFRAGGFNLTVGRETYKPEFIDAFTLGSKNRFLGDTLQVNIEAFHWAYDGQQLAALGVDTLGNNSFYTRNVGESTIQGAEIDLQFAATDSTLLRGSVQYLDATYDSFTYTQVDTSAVTDPPNFLLPINGCQNTQVLLQGETVLPFNPAQQTLPGIRRGFVVDCSGKNALNAPEWTVTVGLEQTFGLGSFELRGSLDARYRDERELGFNFVPDSRVESVVTADASLRLAPAGGNWSATAFVRNLTDEGVPNTYQIGAGNVIASAYEPPRTYGVMVRVEF